MNISILTSQKKITRGFNDFHPIYRWRKEFKAVGLKFNFYNSHKKLKKGDVLIVDYRYTRSLFGDWTEQAKQFTISLCKLSKNNFFKIIFFDTGDSAGSRCFGVLKYVDVFWKKQVFKDLNVYLYDNGEKNWMCWLPSELNEFIRPYDKPKKEDLKKIKVAWNIGYNGYYEANKWIKTVFSNTVFSKSFLKNKFRKAFIEGHIDTCYRVSINTNKRYSYQRHLINENLNKLNFGFNVSSGGKIPKNQYLKEMKGSKMVISPYGWGEICYRDFEAIINGSLLIKPNMSHIDTFPDLFIDAKTYVPITWGIDNLNKKLFDIKENPNDYKQIAEYAQNLYKSHLIDPTLFVNHFLTII